MLRCQELGIDKLPFNAVIKVKLNNGKVFIGDYIDWTSEGDNEPDGESIAVDVNDIQYELFIDEIESIEQVGTY